MLPDTASSGPVTSPMLMAALYAVWNEPIAVGLWTAAAAAASWARNALVCAGSVSGPASASP